MRGIIDIYFLIIGIILIFSFAINTTQKYDENIIMQNLFKKIEYDYDYDRDIELKNYTNKEFTPCKLNQKRIMNNNLNYRIVNVGICDE